ncbi:MAG: SGNH/GDSL hydrolase family protein [Planctomycetia bacterium]|nr:SGNH/GDSL hydrolase family protein [Planctomycetia bacterium]
MARRTRILFVGDSVTAGYGLAGAASFVQLTTDRLTERGLLVETCTDGLDGADSRYLLRRFDRMVTGHDPDWVVLAIGLNDARPPQSRTPCEPADFAGNLLELIDRILSIGARPVLVVPNPRWDGGAPKSAAEDLMQSYAAVVRSIAEALMLPIVDLHHAFMHEPDGMTMIPDGVHPDARGHELMADLTTEELLSLLGAPMSQSAVASQRPFDASYSRDPRRN